MCTINASGNVGSRVIECSGMLHENVCESIINVLMGRLELQRNYSKGVRSGANTVLCCREDKELPHVLLVAPHKCNPKATLRGTALSLVPACLVNTP